MEWISYILPTLASVLSGILLYEWKSAARKTRAVEEEIKRRDDALSKGVEALLRDRLSQRLSDYLALGYATVAERELIEPMYIAYKTLDGNGPITMMYEQFLSLPVSLQGKIKLYEKDNEIFKNR